MTPFELEEEEEEEEEEERASDTAALTQRADGRTVGEVGTSKWTLVTECN